MGSFVVRSHQPLAIMLSADQVRGQLTRIREIRM